MPIDVELVTPERLVFRDQVDFIAAPSTKGEVGILPGHAPLLTQLGVGELRLKKGSEIQFIALTGGFLEVQKGSRVSIFAETAEFAGEIDIERAKQAAEKAKAKLVQAKDLTGVELAAVEAALSRALLRMNIVQNRWRKQPPTKPNQN